MAAAAVTLVRLRGGGHYVAAAPGRRCNDLMYFIGWLELFNALDFPANVWNDVPVPTFAVALMATGGTLAVLASAVAFYDLRKAWRNLGLLRQERRHLRAERANAEPASPAAVHLRAWQLVNQRELGWEFFDRALMDGVVGFGGFLVGIGSLMAPFGADRRIFHASNLLSGYVGNSFGAAYGLINFVWAIYLWRIGSRRSAAVSRHIKDPQTLRRAHCVFRHQKLYAVVFAVTVVVSSVGSMASATMWWGYVVLIPCVFASVFGNVLWRRRVGYDRVVFPHKSLRQDDILNQISLSILAQTKIRDNQGDAFLARFSRAELLAYLIDHDMLDTFCGELAKDPEVRSSLLKDQPKQITIGANTLESIHYDIVLRNARQCLRMVGLRRAIERERLLYELLGSHICAQMEQTSEKKKLASTASMQEGAVLVVGHKEKYQISS